MLLSIARRRTSLDLLDFLVPSLLLRNTSRSLSNRPVNVKFNTVKSLQKPTYIDPSLRALAPDQSTSFTRAQVQLISACQKNDLREVIKSLRLLEEQKLFHALPSAQVADGLQLFLQGLSGGQLNQSDQALCIDLALSAAASPTSMTEPLSTLMLLQLRDRNFIAVTKLYDRFLDREDSKEIWDDAEREDELNPLGDNLVFDENRTDKRVPLGRMTLLLAAIAAHARQGAFEPALQTWLKTGIRLHPPHIDSFVATTFVDDPAFATTFKQFLARLDVARIVSRPISLSKHITNLSSNPSVDALANLYTSLTHGLFGPDAFIAAEPSKRTPAKVVALTEVGWATFLSAFLKYRRRDLASKLWEDLTSLDVTPGVSLWTTLIDAYGANKETDDAVAAWNMMKKEGVRPDPLAYRALISALYKGRKRIDALKAFQTFRKITFRTFTDDQLLLVYNTVIDGLLSFNDEDVVQNILEEMDNQGPKPDLITYNTLLAYHGRRGNFNRIAEILGRMTEVEIAGDVYSFSTILSALLKAGRNDAPELMIDIMRKQGIRPSVATYSAIIDHQMRTPSIHNLEVIMRLLQRMEEDEATRPNIKTYTSILSGLARTEGLDSSRRDEWRKEIRSRMLRNRIDLNEGAYHMIITSCLKFPPAQGLEQGLFFYRQMQRRGLVNDTTWLILLQGLSKRRAWAVAREIIDDMTASGHKASAGVQRLVFQIKGMVR